MNDVPIPARMNRRPRDRRGFVVPYFVQWFLDGKPVDGAVPGAEPDYRVIDHRRMRMCVNKRLCWLCSEPLGVHMTFVLGPMCCINKVISEPPSHRDCAEYALKACPFLSRPRMRRNEKNLIEERVEAPGMPQDRNPGIAALWTTRSYKPFHVDKGMGHEGVLFTVGPFTEVSWWREGRRATREEALAAIEEGHELLKVTAEADGNGAVEELERMTVEAMRTLPL